MPLFNRTAILVNNVNKKIVDNVNKFVNN